jgi:hypothetical protein
LEQVAERSRHPLGCCVRRFGWLDVGLHRVVRRIGWADPVTETLTE